MSKIPSRLSEMETIPTSRPKREVVSLANLHESKLPRSASKIPYRRIPNEWDSDRDFKILSLDGGGMRGIFQATFLGELEKQFLNGKPIGRYFDLITGTSTGGIIALGLGKGLSARELVEFYRVEGRKIFSPQNPLSRKLRGLTRIFKHNYKPDQLRSSLLGLFGDAKLGDSDTMLCIPSSEGQHRDVCVFKTDHHSDFIMDWQESMVHVGMATSAAPTYFKALKDGGYKLLDGGLWANNPILVGVVEAITSFNVSRRKIKVLSLGNSLGVRSATNSQMRFGGIWSYRHIVETIMEFQSEGAIGQACLLVGADSVIRVSPNSQLKNPKPIMLDDWTRCVEQLPGLAEAIVKEKGSEISSFFLETKCPSYNKKNQSSGSHQTRQTRYDQEVKK